MKVTAFTLTQKKMMSVFFKGSCRETHTGSPHEEKACPHISLTTGNLNSHIVRLLGVYIREW